MGEQIPRVHTRAGVGIVPAEVRQHRHHRLLPAQPPAVHQGRHRGGGGGGAGGQIPDAETFHQRQPAFLHQGDRGAGHRVFH